MSRFLTDEIVIPIFEHVIQASDYVIPTYEDVSITYEILVLSYHEGVKSESVTSNRYRIEVTPHLRHWICWGG